MKLEIIIASTRPVRRGGIIGRWFAAEAEKHGKFEVSVADLKKINLPFLDEPHEAGTRQYTKQHTKAWSARIDAADAFVIVTPEYNYTAPAALINAMDFLYHEWAYKPVGFVSYGGISGGTRSVQNIKQQVTTLQMMPMKPAVNIPFVKTLIEDGKFKSDERVEKSAVGMLDELWRWAEAMKSLR